MHLFYWGRLIAREAEKGQEAKKVHLVATIGMGRNAKS